MSIATKERREYSRGRSRMIFGVGLVLMATALYAGNTSYKLWGRQTKGWGHSVNAKSSGNRLVLKKTATIVSVKGDSKDYCIWSVVTPKNYRAKSILCGGENRPTIIGRQLQPGTYTVLPAAGSQISINLK